MIRSNTKNIYTRDNDFAEVRNVSEVVTLVNELTKRVASKGHGFARYYPHVVGEYFGGMRRHLRRLQQVLRRGAYAAFVVGDQSAYAQLHIPTAAILEVIAADEGFDCIRISEWRARRVSLTSKIITENILTLKRR